MFLNVQFISCKEADEAVEPEKETQLNPPYMPDDHESVDWPAHFTTNVHGQPLPTSIEGTDNNPEENPITNQGVPPCQALFYDKRLSANGSISCAFCHRQEKGFSDASLSISSNGGKTGRYSLPLINALLYQWGRYFWDERATFNKYAIRLGE